MMTWDIRYIDENFLVWIIPSAYLSHEAENWGCTAGLAIFFSSGFTSNFWYYYYYIIIIILLYMFRSWLPLVFYSTSLLFLLYYTMHVPCLISLTISACACMYVLTTRFSIHALLIWIYRYTRVCPCTPFGTRIITHWVASDNPGLVCLYLEPGA